MVDCIEMNHKHIVDRMKDGLREFEMNHDSKDSADSEDSNAGSGDTSCLAFGLEGISEDTFDFDQYNEKASRDTRSQERKERLAEDDMTRFQSNVAFLEKQRKERLLKQQPALELRPKRKVDVVTDMSEIEDLDRGKTWRQLDDYLKRKRLTEYARRREAEGGTGGTGGSSLVEQLLEEFRKGKYRKTNEVVYDVTLGQIVEI